MFHIDRRKTAVFGICQLKLCNCSLLFSKDFFHKSTRKTERGTKFRKVKMSAVILALICESKKLLEGQKTLRNWEGSLSKSKTIFVYDTKIEKIDKNDGINQILSILEKTCVPCIPLEGRIKINRVPRPIFSREIFLSWPTRTGGYPINIELCDFYKKENAISKKWFHPSDRKESGLILIWIWFISLMMLKLEYSLQFVHIRSK